MNFFAKLNDAIAQNQSLLCLGLDPDPELCIAAQSLTGRDRIAAFSRWLQFLLTETADLVCAYKLTLGFYHALGTFGLELFEQVIQAIPTEIPIILDAKHSDLATSTVLAETVFEQWNLDAITLSGYAGQDLVAPFLVYPDKAVFVLACSANPSAKALQEYGNNRSPFYLHLVEEAKTWGTPEQLGLEVGTSKTDTFTRLRTLAPERIILAQDTWAESSDLEGIITAGLNKNGEGLILSIPSDCLTQKSPAHAIRELRDRVNSARIPVVQESSSCELWFSDVCLLQQQPHQDLILQLYDLGCIMFGNYVQASGATFPYYIDLRTIISHPQTFHQVLSAYSEILKDLSFDRIAGIPYGSLPTATGLSLRLDHPMVFPRKEVKAHGTGRLVEGHFNPGETVVVVDDILISGKSAIEGAAKLKSTGLKVEDIVVLIDHEKGVKDKLREIGYCAHSVLKLSEIAQTLYQAGRINDEQFQLFNAAH